MTANQLPNEDHVVRYAKYSDFLDLESETLNCSAFQLKPNESGLSVNWLEYSQRPDKASQLDEIRGLIQLRMGPRARLAELNVGSTVAYVGDELPNLRFIRSPSHPRDSYPADPSHSEILGLPSAGSPVSELIADMIAECVTALHPTVP